MTVSGSKFTSKHTLALAISMFSVNKYGAGLNRLNRLIMLDRLEHGVMGYLVKL